MTNALTVDMRTFTFPSGWEVSKFDEWAFYKNQFQSQALGYKAVDLVAVSPDNCLYLIEVKDYVVPGSKPPPKLPEIVAKKVVDTLAAIIPASVNGNVTEEARLADLARRCSRIRVVLHCELPRRHLLHIDPNVINMQLQKLVKAIDPHPVVVNSASPQLPWAVATTRTTS